MSTSHRRGAQPERDAAKALRSARTGRVGCRQRHADVAPVVVEGLTLSPEAKHRRRLPRLIVDGLAQAASYVRGSVPLLVIRELGGRAVACLPLDAFVRIAGIDAGALPQRHTPTKRTSTQLDLLEMFGPPSDSEAS